MSVQFYSAQMLPLTPFDGAPPASVPLTITLLSVDPSDMRCQFDRPWNNPNWHGKKKQTWVDIDLTKHFQGAEQRPVKVTMVIAPNVPAFFIDDDQKAITAGDGIAQEYMKHLELAGAGTGQVTQVSFYCLKGREGLGDPRPFNVGLAVWDRNNKPTHEMPVFYDPAIKNDG